MVKGRDNNKQRLRRHRRVRGKISGTAKCPRLCVFRSQSHIYAQLINDEKGVTIASVSSNAKNFEHSGRNKEGAREVGKQIAAAAKKKRIKTVVFDRGGYLYHGRVQELADGAREAGLNF